VKPIRRAAGINPLQPAVWADGKRFPLQTHADLVKSLFPAAFEADEPFPQVLNAALGDLQAAADVVVRQAAYGPEVERNVREFIMVRLGTPGRFLEGGHQLDFGRRVADVADRRRPDGKCGPPYACPPRPTEAGRCGYGRTDCQGRTDA
jgi:hypothetical protein